MIYIQHRINTVTQLMTVPYDYGVEFDLRDLGQDIIMQHDAFGTGERFEDYLKEYQHAFMILNVKSEGVEVAALKLIQQYNIKNFFFLDLSFPALIKMINNNVSQIAMRVSEYEPIESCLQFAGRVEWIWVDCFTKFPLDKATYTKLKDNFKLCLVSPELQGHSLDRIAEFKQILVEMPFDAVCTKRIDLWT